MQQLLENIVSVKKKKKSVSVTKATGKKNQRNVNSMNGQINSINYIISVIPSNINRNSRKKNSLHDQSAAGNRMHINTYGSLATPSLRLTLSVSLGVKNSK